MLPGITNAAVTGLLGGSDMDITKAFIGGYLFGVAAGIGAVLLTAAVTNALLLARFYVITATAGAAMSVGAAIYAIMTNNKKAAIVYGVLAVLSIFNMAEAYNYYCQVWLIGEKGIAAFSTADFSVSKGMSEVNAMKPGGEYNNTADYLTNIVNRNGKFYADKTTIDKIGQIEAKGEDFSLLNKEIMSSRASTEGGLSIVYKYSDGHGTKYIIHEVTDANGYIIHRDFDAVRILSGQLINKEY